MIDDVTVEDVTEDMPMFENFTTKHVQNAISKAKLQAKADEISPDAFNMGVIEFAKHLLYIDYFMSYGGVTASSMMGTSQTIADKTDNDPYLNQYNNTVSLFGNGGDEDILFL